MLDLIIRGGRVVTPEGAGLWDIAIAGEQITAVAAPEVLKDMPAARIVDASGKLVVLVCFNTDLMDGAELAGDARYPERYSIYALKVFINAIIYAMSH